MNTVSLRHHDLLSNVIQDVTTVRRVWLVTLTTSNATEFLIKLIPFLIRYLDWLPFWVHWNIVNVSDKPLHSGRTSLPPLLLHLPRQVCQIRILVSKIRSLSYTYGLFKESSTWKPMQHRRSEKKSDLID